MGEPCGAVSEGPQHVENVIELETVYFAETWSWEERRESVETRRRFPCEIHE